MNTQSLIDLIASRTDSIELMLGLKCLLTFQAYDRLPSLTAHDVPPFVITYSYRTAPALGRWIDRTCPK
jgi:hypothetical protein